jgi:type I restriction enzyme, S subunit
VTASTPGWLAEFPATWQLKPAKAAFRERREPNLPDDVHLTPSQTHGVLPQTEYMSRTGNAVVQNIQGQDSMKHVEPDDFIIHLRSFQGGIERSTYEGKVSTAYTVLEPSKFVVADYFRWLLKSDGYIQELRTTTNQLRDGQSIKFRDFAKIPLPMPPLEEQRAIADYLDRETARIDTLIEEQQRLIEMLRERRQSAIRSVLLAGLDDEVPRRWSSAALLGDIPSHWRMVPTRYLCTITTGSEDSGNATDAGAYPFYVRGREVLRIDHYSFDGEAVMTPGDGQGGTGKVFHYVNGKFEAHQRVYVFKDFIGISGWYFYYFLSAFLRPVALAGSNTVTMESLRRPLLADFRVAVPPLEEQHQIATYLDEQTARMDELIAESEQFIKLARERRSALITAALTGQIDVREMV